jgi:hypothetical protein
MASVFFTFTKDIISLLDDTFTSGTYSKNISNEIVEHYKKFIGSEEVLDTLLKRFSEVKFGEGILYQYLTSRTTTLSGTGLGSSSVRATYRQVDETNKNRFSVLNQSFDENLKPIFINGFTDARDSKIPTCRTVSFTKIGITGDYWIAHVSKDLSSMIVVSPLIIPGTSQMITPTFSCYILSKLSKEEFWPNKPLIGELLEATTKFGFTNFLNKPLPTSDTGNPNVEGSTEVESSLDQLN